VKRTALEILIALIVIVLAVSVPTIAILVRTTTIPSFCSIKAVGVSFFWDHAATQPVTNVTWGLVLPGSNNSKLLYCEDTKNSNETMTLTVGNWNPANTGLYAGAGWNYTGTVLHPGNVIPVQFWLDIYSNATSSGITSFSFNYNATATAV
jgi:hypothetical protein